MNRIYAMKKLHVILFECTKMIKSYALVLEKKMMFKTAFTYDLVFLQQVKKIYSVISYM